MSKLSEQAVNHFKYGLYCSEAIVKAFNENYDLKLSKDALNIATAFGVGLGGSKCVCGWLTGGVVILSSIYGRTSKDVSEAKLFEATSKLHDEFKKTFGATCCRALTKPVECGAPEHHKYCERFVIGAAEITERLLQELSEGG